MEPPSRPNDDQTRYQAQYWNGPEASHWLVHEHRYEPMLAPFTRLVLGAAVDPSSRPIRQPRAASSTPEAAVTTNTPSGERRQASSGTVEHAASTTATRSSSPDPGWEAPIPRSGADCLDAAVGQQHQRGGRGVEQRCCARPGCQAPVRGGGRGHEHAGRVAPRAPPGIPRGGTRLHWIGTEKIPPQGVSAPPHPAVAWRPWSTTPPITASAWSPVTST